MTWFDKDKMKAKRDKKNNKPLPREYTPPVKMTRKEGAQSTFSIGPVVKGSTSKIDSYPDGRAYSIVSGKRTPFRGRD